MTLDLIKISSFGEDSDKSVHQSDLWRERLDFEALTKYKFLIQPIIGDLKENNPKENNPHHSKET